MKYGPKHAELFWAKVDKGTKAACWEWRGHCYKKTGYGQVWRNHKKLYAHRISWELTNGSIPPGLEICHKCDNPPCVNPAHLYAGTHKQNMEDMKRRGRANGGGLQGEQVGTSKLKSTDIPKIRYLYSRGWSQREIARFFRVTRCPIKRIVCRDGWNHVPDEDF